MTHLSTVLSPPAVTEPALLEEPLFTPASAPIEGIATHYGAGYSGQTLACGGIYVSNDPTIIAVGSSRDAEWGCGVYLNVCGATGCVIGVRQDSCPGCGAYHVDLSEAAIELACGVAADRCDVTIQKMQPMSRAGADPPPR